ncbi:hypothetical protein ACFCV8_12410 [Streptomyces sp. NPDC056347]|uniref:hypothetical protein n=1 Tax=Streptomyces sp. NPDC056347 TaxID=3345790 RepID=UPI0035D95284
MERYASRAEGGGHGPVRRTEHRPHNLAEVAPVGTKNGESPGQWRDDAATEVGRELRREVPLH